jgi:hypothetical protein
MTYVELSGPRSFILGEYLPALFLMHADLNALTTVKKETEKWNFLPLADRYLARHRGRFSQAVHDRAMGYDLLSEFPYPGFIIRAFYIKRISQVFKSGGYIIQHEKPSEVERAFDIYGQRIDRKTFMHGKLIKGGLDAGCNGGEEKFYRVRRLVVSAGCLAIIRLHKMLARH